MKKFIGKIYSLSQSNRKIRFTGLNLNEKKKYKKRTLNFIVNFNKKNLFVSFFNKTSKPFSYNQSAGAMNLKGGYQASKKIFFLFFHALKKNFSKHTSRDITLSLNGRSWLKKRFLAHFFSYWNLLHTGSLKKYNVRSKAFLKFPQIQTLLLKNNTRKAFNGCRVRKPKR